MTEQTMIRALTIPVALGFLLGCTASTAPSSGSGGSNGTGAGGVVGGGSGGNAATGSGGSATGSGGTGGSVAGTGGRSGTGGSSAGSGGAVGTGGRGGAAATGTGGVAATGGAGGALIWPNAISFTNSDTWLSQNHDQITQLQPKVLLLNFAADTTTKYSLANTMALATKHINAIKEASSPHKYKNPAAQPTVAFQLVKIVQAGQANKPVSGTSLNYAGLNTQAMADLIGIADPANPGTNLTMCGLFEKGLINEVWGMVPDGETPKFDETAETKQVYDANNQKVAGRFACVSNGTCIQTLLPCTVSTRVYDFNPTRGAGCHQHAMGHAWENYINRGAIPALQKSAKRFLNVDMDVRLGAPFPSFYSACSSTSAITSDCMVWPSNINIASGATASRTFNIPDMSAGCGNAHYYPNTIGNYSYEVATTNSTEAQDPTVLSSCENYGLKNGPGGKDLTTSFNNRMTFSLYAGNTNVDSDCGGRGTMYIYQSFPGPGSTATNDDGTPMRDWWVYLYY